MNTAAAKNSFFVNIIAMMPVAVVVISLIVRLARH